MILLYTKRINNVIKNMEKMNIKQIIVYSKYSIYYLTGIWIEAGERFISLYINIHGNIVLFANSIFNINKNDIQIILHDDNDNAVNDLCSTILCGEIGIDKNLPSKFLMDIMNLRKDVIPINGSMPVDMTRMIKDSEEIKRIKYASSLNDEVITKSIKYIRNGITESALEKFINNIYIEKGATKNIRSIVAFGKNTSNPHHKSDNTIIEDGDCILIDIFRPIKNYWCDMTRTIFFKYISDEQKKIYNIVKQANIEAIKKIKNGVALNEIDKTARSYIEQKGYGKYFIHRTGHNIGLECHEIPDVSYKSEFIAKTGMVFSIEPGIYIPNKFGVRIEDIILVTDYGCEILNKYTKEIQIIK